MRNFTNLFDYLWHVRESPKRMLGGVVSYNRLSCYIDGYKLCLLIYEGMIRSDEERSIQLFTTLFEEFLRGRLSGSAAEKWGFTAMLVACVQPDVQEPCDSITDPELDEKVVYKFFELYDEFLKHNENNEQPEMRNRPEWYI